MQNTAKARTRGYLDYPNTNWDPNRTYRQAVVLITFKDCEFSMPDPVDFYRHILNEPGYNEGAGAGCLADYFRDQSEGLFNLQFDVYGPVLVDTLSTGNGKTNYGEYVVRKATQTLAQSADIDFSPYDWDGDGTVEQVIYIAAGFCGNQVQKGYIWPNTGNFYPSVTMPGNVKVDYYSISCEKWKDGASCGIGTICHEFTHCLGLPDIYPTNNTVFSVVDEWDLMDGGNYTGKGWCPPNYSALEKMLLGWKTPVELTDETVITGMKPAGEGGEAYIIRNSGNDDEFYLLENRQQNGWDYAAPGSGLLIFHVDYDREVWSNNNVNTSKSHFRYSLFHADGKSYQDWDPNDNGQDFAHKYSMEGWMRNRYLSTSPYPFVSDSLGVVNQALTDDSDPAATLFNNNADGGKLMSKPITGIQMADDGTISFGFMKDPVSVVPIRYATDVSSSPVWYDLNGCRLPSAPPLPGIYILRYTDGTTKKCIR